MEALRRVKAEHRGVAIRGNALAVQRYAKGVRRVVEHIQAVLFCNAVNRGNVAGISVDMHGQNRACFRGNVLLQMRGVERKIVRLHVAEHGGQSAADNRMRGGDKRKRRGQYLAFGNARGGQGAFQREMPVCKEAQIWRFELLRERGLQLLVLRASVGQKTGLEDFAHERFIFLHRRQRRARHQNGRILFLHTGGSPFYHRRGGEDETIPFIVAAFR